MSIYNKILQLGIAVILIAGIFSFWFTSFSQTQDVVSEQFKSTGDNFVQQAVVTIKVLKQNKRQKELKQFIEGLSQAPLVHEARLYDQDGKLIAETADSGSVKSLFGIAQEGPDTSSKATQFVPFVAEIRTDRLLGYLRVNLKREPLTQPLDITIEQQSKFVSLMLIFAGVAGFLLTLGLRRFNHKNMYQGKPLEK